MYKNYWTQYFYLLLQLLLRFWGILNMTIWEQGNHLAGISTRVSIGTSGSQVSVMV